MSERGCVCESKGEVENEKREGVWVRLSDRGARVRKRSQE